MSLYQYIAAQWSIECFRGCIILLKQIYFKTVCVSGYCGLLARSRLQSELCEVAVVVMAILLKISAG